MKGLVCKILLLLCFTEYSYGVEISYRMTCAPQGENQPSYTAEVDASGLKQNIGNLVQFQGVQISINGGDPYYDPEATLNLRGPKPEDIVSVLFNYKGQKGFMTRTCPMGNSLECPSLLDPASGEVSPATCKVEMVYKNAELSTRSLHVSEGNIFPIADRIQCISKDKSMAAEISEFYVGIILIRRIHKITIHDDVWYKSRIGKILPGEAITIGEEITVHGFSDRIEVTLDGEEKYVAECLR